MIVIIVNGTVFGNAKANNNIPQMNLKLSRGLAPLRAVHISATFTCDNEFNCDEGATLNRNMFNVVIVESFYGDVAKVVAMHY